MDNLVLPAQGLGSVRPVISMIELADGTLVENVRIGTVVSGVFVPSVLALDSTLQAILAAQTPSIATQSALSNVPGSSSSVTLQPANPLRKGLVIVNDSTSILYVKFGTAATPTSWTYLLSGSQAAIPATYEMSTEIYTGLVTGIWASATGFARVTELT